MSRSAQLNTEIKIPNNIKKDAVNTNSNQNNINSAQNITEKLKPSVTTSSNLRNSSFSEGSSNSILKNNISFFNWKKQINKIFKNVYEGSKTLLPSNKNKIVESKKKLLNITLEKYKPFQKIPNSTLHLLLNRRGGKGSIDFTLFLVKIAITASTIYGSFQLGVWGSTEDSSKAAKKVLDFFDFEQSTKVFNFQNIHLNLKEEYNQTLKNAAAKVEGFPETAITFYNDSLRFVFNTAKPD